MRGLFEKDIRIIKNQKKNDADLCWNGSFTASVRCGDFLYLALYGIRDDERCDQHDQL